MKKICIILVLLIIFLALIAEEYVPRQIMVQFNKDVSDSRQTEIFKLEELTAVHQLSRRLSIWLCEIGNNISENEAIVRIKKIS